MNESAECIRLASLAIPKLNRDEKKDRSKFLENFVASVDCGFFILYIDRSITPRYFLRAYFDGSWLVRIFSSKDQVNTSTRNGKCNLESGLHALYK